MADAANDTVTALHGDADTQAETTPLELHDEVADWEEEEQWDFAIEPRPMAEKLQIAVLSILALGWIGFVGWAVWNSAAEAALTPVQIANWVAVVCIPLVTLSVVWILLRRTSRREAERFGQTSEAMRAEARRLDEVLASVSGQLTEMQGKVSRDTDKLISLGEEATSRLGTIGSDLRDAGDVIEERSKLLDATAKSARDDVEVLMADLPRAERQARAVSAGLREAGVNAHEQAVSLDAQLSALANRGREADEIANSAAQKLAAHLTQIEGVAEVSARKLDETGEHINAAVETALAESSEAVEGARKAMNEIGQSLVEMVTGARNSLEDEGQGASAALDERIAAIGETVAGLNTQLGSLEERVVSVNDAGASKLAQIGETVEALQSEFVAMADQMGGSDEKANGLIARAAEVKAALDLSIDSLSGALPEAITAAETRTDDLKGKIAEVTPDMAALKEMAGDANNYIAVTRESLGEQREAIDNFVQQIGERILTMREDISSIETSLAVSGEQATSIADSAAPQLIETLLRVRETADQAAEKARAAFGEVIPQSAAALSEATEMAMNEVLGETVENRVAEINAASERAVTAARAATEELASKINEIETMTAAIETRIEEGVAAAEAADMDGFARQVTLLIESLNSTAIDVTKILSNDVTDTAWAAYLKGDRGIFARRAVRLLDTGEAREIAAQYEMDGEFAEQVNRYVHDFEAMLRRVLATRDGSPLAVTLLSSDNGKLYVALAQAIERFRD